MTYTTPFTAPATPERVRARDQLAGLLDALESPNGIDAALDHLRAEGFQTEHTRDQAAYVLGVLESRARSFLRAVDAL